MVKNNIMVTPGKYNTLNISKIVDFGVYLDGGEFGEILLPMKWVPEDTKPTDRIEVFVYFDSSDRVIATTMKPYAVVGDFAMLKVKAVNDVGAFLDWGLEKDLLLPYREQTHTVQKDMTYPVYVYADDKGRIAASMHLEKFIDKNSSALIEGDEVELLLYAATDLGFKAIVNNRYEGIVYANEVFQQLSKGYKSVGYIKKVREDGKIDLSLYKTGYQNKITDLAEKIITALKNNNGFLPLGDKSSPEEIYSSLGISKKNFKQSIGNLYKAGVVRIESEGIFLN
jgi:uncharacterized protein